MLRLLYRSFFELKRIRYDSMFLRYQINFLSDTSLKDIDEVSSENYRRKVVMDMMRRTPHFEDTEFYVNMRSDVVKNFKNRMKNGRILLNGSYQTLFGNPYEFLTAVIDKKYEPKEPMLLRDGEIYTARFDDGERILGARNPHITMGNLFLSTNIKCPEIDEYFNLTKEIVCVNAINSNIQQRLNGCDYDSDTMLITNNGLLVNLTEHCYELFGVPVCCVSPVGKTEFSDSPEDLARLDRAISENEIGNIVNLSQFLNCLFWHRMMEGEPFSALMPLYYEICKLAVLSGMEIDKAKRLYDVEKYTVLRKLSKLRQRFKEENEGKLPNFYYTLTGAKENLSKENRANMNTPMAYIYDAVEGFSMHSIKRKRILLRDLFELDVSDADSNDSKRKRKIIETVSEAYKAMRQCKIGAEDDEDAKAVSIKRRKAIFAECLDTVSRNVVNDHVLHLVLNELDKSESKTVTGAKSMIFACILYEKEARLLSKVKTPEDYKCVDLKVFKGPKKGTNMAIRKLLTNGNAFKRTDGRWGGTVWYMDETGERKRKSFSGTTKQVVTKKMTAYVETFNTEIAASSEANKKLSVSMQNWLQVFKFPSVERTTYDRYEATAKHQIYPLIGNKTVDNITSADIKKVLNHWMTAGYAYTTVKKVYIILGEYFKYLTVQEMIPKNPMNSAPMIKKSNFYAIQEKEELPASETITIFTAEEIEKLKAEASKAYATGKKLYRQAGAYIFMLNTGLRAGEMLGVLNADIDLERRILHLQRGVKVINKRDGAEILDGSTEVKVGKLKSATSKRDIPLNDIAIKMIEELRSEFYFGEDTPLVCDENGGFTNPERFRRRYHRLLEGAGIESKGLHSLRHTFATNLVNGVEQPDGSIKSLSVKQVANLLGHSTTQVTEMYYVKRDQGLLSGITNDFCL